MPILYKLRQDNRKNSVNKGKWYARSIMNGTVGTNELANIMQRNCTLKKSDIIAVIAELVETMQDQLQNSMRVKLDGFGAFKIGLKTTPADSAKNFNAAQNVVDMRVNFQPEVHISKDHSRKKTFLDGAKVLETAQNAVVKIPTTNP